MKFGRTSFTQQLRELRDGFVAGLREFNRASREIQDELSAAPFTHDDFVPLRVLASIIVLFVYTFVSISLSLDHTGWFIASSLCAVFVTLRLLRWIWTTGQ